MAAAACDAEAELGKAAAASVAAAPSARNRWASGQKAYSSSSSSSGRMMVTDRGSICSSAKGKACGEWGGGKFRRDRSSSTATAQVFCSCSSSFTQ